MAIPVPGMTGEQAADRARLADDVKGFPDGFSAIVGERGITLSGGQRQRTALGRALLVSAPVLVLDDALASVDNNTTAPIWIPSGRRRIRTIVMIISCPPLQPVITSW